MGDKGALAITTIAAGKSHVSAADMSGRQTLFKRIHLKSGIALEASITMRISLRARIIGKGETANDARRLGFWTGVESVRMIVWLNQMCKQVGLLRWL